MKRLAFAIALLLAGCDEVVTPVQWAAMERACATFGGIMYSLEAGMLGGKPVTSFKVRCADGTVVVGRLKMVAE